MPDKASKAVEGISTFPRLLMHHAKVRGNHPAMREKDLGIWQTWTWEDVREQVVALAGGMAKLGLKRGDNVAIIGDNRPRLYLAMTAVQCLGGVPVPLYQDAVANEMQFALQDAEVTFAFAENQEQVDKLLEIRDSLPALAHIIYDDPRGMRHYDQPFLHNIEAAMALGREYNAAHPGFVAAEIDKGESSDTAVMLYTSGTTGKPKGVCQAHHAFISAARGACQFDGLTADEETLSYLPMAWVGDHLFSYAQALVAGFTINCPESSDTVMSDLREIGPTYYFAPPRIFENLLTQVMIRMEDAGAIKRRMFHFFMDVAKRCGADILDGKPVGFADRMLYSLGNALVYGPLKNVLGLSRIRVGYTAGAAIGPDLFRFYRSIGINLKQFYGQTETCAYVCLQPNGEIKLDSVGKPGPFVEVKISDKGEILVKGPMLLKEYYKRPDSTAEAIDAEGYFLTGDAGFFDEDGHLKIIDRAKDVGKLANGAMFAPNYIENKLKFFPYIKEAVCFGHNRGQVCAFINIDMEAVGNWAEKRGIAYAGYTDLAAKPEVYGLIQECVEKVNSELIHDPMLADSQVARFLVLHKELDPDDDELTRTRKVRRGFIAEKYGVLVDAFYAGRSSQYIETQVKFEDGRSGMVAADLRICDAKTYAIPQRQAA
ncbi:long-chain acyl-CoA synthetase [Oryzomicrobium terrae]|uniref:Long-chain acyl-CoA synthetase n=1 Tax=Oryzomicrobium terrae TaxID=1735038 RepID=A0A5C1EBJ3_9RHOO|nr:AMP-binding protein [Oryzomicrobium terrae]QEL66252.1 long-chain acyl-CoA synthetase [Oryzomicrobium terrae]